jgi:hypothetical protein
MVNEMRSSLFRVGTGSLVVAGLAATVGFAIAAALGGGSTAEPPPHVPEVYAVYEPAQSEATVADSATGDVTPAQMHGAIAAYHTCLEDNGVTVEIVFPGEGMRMPVWQTSVDIPEGAADAVALGSATASSLACREEHLTPVEQRWVAQLAPSAQDIEALYSWVEQCVADGGVPRHGVVPQQAVVLWRYDLDTTPRFQAKLPPGSLNAMRQCFVEQQAVTGLGWPLVMARTTAECRAELEALGKANADVSALHQFNACLRGTTVEDMFAGPGGPPSVPVGRTD